MLLLFRVHRALGEASESRAMLHSFLSKCETGERSVDVIDLLQLAKLYGKPIQYFPQELIQA